ncbi:phage tail protein [Aromatoleum buckelii]|uniref:Phage tail protein n=1 Tax=Aromatoleum buckelii TaxID=200254 RepID=A0ABX1N500_9RHOO|nr:phage tail protein [Aromatoleum buckelii]MCK0509724.1 phage tail protein [Aromatoleum buckelii]
MALLAPTALRADPVLNHNFVVSLLDTSSVLATIGSAALSAALDVAVGGFSECSGIEMTMKPEPYKEGGANGFTRQFPNRVEWSAITLKKGIGSGNTLWDWHYGFVIGKGKRRDGLIVLLSDLHVPNNVWFFRRGLPSKYSGPQMNAMQNSVAIESIEITHEGIFQLPFVGAATALASAVAGGGFGASIAAAGSTPGAIGNLL